MYCIYSATPSEPVEGNSENGEALALFLSICQQCCICVQSCWGVMGGKDLNFQVVYRGEVLANFKPGGWVFFQRPKECGGRYWLGRTYDDVFMIEYERPVSLNEGMRYLLLVDKVESKSDKFITDLSLF